MFTCSTKREVRHFHVVVLQGRQRNVQKSGMQVQRFVLLIETYCYYVVPIAVVVVV